MYQAKYLITCLLFCSVIGFGCSQRSEGNASILGRLTLNGQPLQTGTQVILEHESNKERFLGTTSGEGNFKINNLIGNRLLNAGQYRVLILPPDPEEIPAEVLADNPELAEPKIDFPSKYADPQTSGLSYEVTAGENFLEIDLQPE